MPASNLVLEKSAQKNLLKLPVFIHQKVIKAFNVIKENPLVGFRLKGELSDYFKYRIGDYRIIYKFDTKSKNVWVVKIEHRQGVYK